MKQQESQAEQAGQAEGKEEVEKRVPLRFLLLNKCYFLYFFGGLECIGHSFAYVVDLVFLKDVWIRTQRAAVASRRATNLATHLSNVKLAIIFSNQKDLMLFLFSITSFLGLQT